MTVPSPSSSITTASLALPGGITLPTGLRFLTTVQIAEAKKVFGISLDFSHILLSDATGASSRPFTVHVEVLPGLAFVVINRQRLFLRDPLASVTVTRSPVAVVDASRMIRVRSAFQHTA